MVVIIQMAADTGVRGIVIIPVMALVTIRNAGMCPGQCPVIVMGRKRSRAPSGISGMTSSASG